MWLATMETSHFSFTAAGASEEKAKLALVQGFSRHLARSYDDEADRTEAHAREHWWAGHAEDQMVDFMNDEVWLAGVGEWFGIHAFRIKDGECVRDGDVVV